MFTLYLEARTNFRKQYPSRETNIRSQLPCQDVYISHFHWILGSNGGHVYEMILAFFLAQSRPLDVHIHF